MHKQVYSSVLLGTGLGLETGTSGAEAGESDMASNLTTYEEIISNRRTPIRRSLTLNLSFRRLGHQVWRLESRAQPRVLLQVVDVHVRRYLIMGRSQGRSYLWLWHKC